MGGDHLQGRGVEVDVAGRPVEVGVAELEDAAVAAEQPVATAIRRAGNADNRPVEGVRRHVAIPVGVTLGGHGAVGPGHPEAAPVRSRRGGHGRAGDHAGLAEPS